MNKDMDEILEGLFSVLPVFRKKVHKLSDNILRDKEISRPHVQIMKNLKINGPCSMTELGKMLSVSKPNITTLVNKLVELNIVKRKYKENDRRLTYIELTEHGEVFFLKIVETMKNALSKSLQKFNENDLNLFKETLNNMKILIRRMNEEK